VPFLRLLALWWPVCYTTLQFVVNGLFSDINISQSSAATYARCSRIFNKQKCTANLLKTLAVKNWKIG